jgi:ribosome-binding ATPase YchF (GTP1/OBG family)
MGFRCGIVGLPNVGKSTLFNALTRTAAAQAANFPFCTIEPNVGEVAVPDDRLDRLAAIAKSKQVIPTRLTFVDIAGLVRGASKGEGLGNQFLANIREVDAIAHVLRCFEDGDVTHVEGRVDPVADADTIETELMLADLESIERRLQNLSRKVAAATRRPSTSRPCWSARKRRWRRAARRAPSRCGGGGEGLADAPAADGQAGALCLQCRGGERRRGQRPVGARGGDGGGAGRGSVVISAKIEEELAQLDDEERDAFLADLGLEEPGSTG